MTPSDRRYTKTHEWALVDGGEVIVGITDHAQHQLGDLTFIDLPETGDRVVAGEECLVIESVKAASDVYSPVTGEIAAVNEALRNHPEFVNEDAYDRGWLIRVRVKDPSVVERLLKSCDYEALIGDEE